MKQLLLFAALACSSIVVTAASKNSDENNVRKCIALFSTYAGDRDIAGMERILHADFRVIANQLMGGDAVSLIDKQTYLQFLRDKKFGGETRVVSINSIEITGNNACVKVAFEGEKAVFTSFMLLVKSKVGEWTIISDLPSVSAK